MKRISLGSLVVFCWAWAVVAPGQVELSWSLANNRTVLMEPVRAMVRIANHTGQPLDLTERGNARLSFDVEDQPTSTVAGTGKPLLQQPIIIPVGETREIEVNLLEAYRIVKGQSYMLTPLLEFDGIRFAGQRLSLEVQPGIELLKRDYGMPSSGDARQVSLRLVHRDRNDRLFFRIDNSSTGYCLGVYDLGRVIRFFTPCLEQDAEGAFHVLHQSGPDRFAHSTFGYDGAPLGVGFYSAQVGNVRLVRKEIGELDVTGGTPYVEDPESPGLLVAPALPPSHPYNMTLGEQPATDRGSAPAATSAAKESARPQPKSEKSHAGSEPVSW